MANKVNLNLNTEMETPKNNTKDEKISISKEELQKLIAKNVESIMSSTKQHNAAPTPQIIHVGDTNNHQEIRAEIHKRAKGFEQKWKIQPNNRYMKDLQTKVAYYQEVYQKTGSYIEAKLEADKKFPRLVTVVYGAKQEGPMDVTYSGAKTHVDYQFEKSKETYVYIEDYIEIIGKLNGATERQPIKIPETVSTNSGAPIDIQYETFVGDTATPLPVEMANAVPFHDKEKANNILREVLTDQEEKK